MPGHRRHTQANPLFQFTKTAGCDQEPRPISRPKPRTGRAAPVCPPGESADARASCQARPVHLFRAIPVGKRPRSLDTKQTVRAAEVQHPAACRTSEPTGQFSRRAACPGPRFKRNELGERSCRQHHAKRLAEVRPNANSAAAGSDRLRD